MFIQRSNLLRQPAPILALMGFVSVIATSPTLLAAGYTFTTIIDNAGSQVPNFSSLGQRKINDSGDVAFLTSPSFASYRIDRSNGASSTQVADSSFWGLDYNGNGAIANSGDVVFRGGATGTSVGIYRGNGGVPTPLLIGNETQDNVDGDKLSFQAISVSNSGAIAYGASSYSCANSVCSAPVYGYYTLIGGSSGTLAQTGATWSDVGTSAPVINDSAQAAFVMRSAQDGTNHLVFHNGTNAASVKADFNGGKGYSLNNAGQLAYAEIPAVKVITNGVTTTVASTADGFDSLMKVGTGEVFINDSGQVAFWGSVSQYQSQPVNWQGIYTGPDILNDRVVIVGDSVLGHAVNHVELLGMNNAGQMLLSVESQSPDPWTGLVVATPDVLPGDYNEDDAVDAADYVVWRKKGIIGQPGYDTWRAHFGETNAPGSGANTTSTAIPEPASLVLLIVAAASTLQRRPRRWRNCAVTAVSLNPRGGQKFLLKRPRVYAKLAAEMTVRA